MIDQRGHKKPIGDGVHVSRESVAPLDGLQVVERLEGQVQLPGDGCLGGGTHCPTLVEREGLQVLQCFVQHLQVSN